MKSAKLYIVLIVNILFIIKRASAGWVITQESYGSFTAQQIETIYVEDNLLKTTTTDGMMIFDLKNNLFFVFNMQHKIYWSGSLNEYKQRIKDVLNLQMQQTIKQLPKDKQDNAKKVYQIMILEMEKSWATPKDKIKWLIEIKPFQERQSFSQFQAERYEVWVDGSLRQEVWLSEQVNIAQDIDFEKYNELIKTLKGSYSDFAFQQTPEYSSLYKKGLIFKTVEYQQGETLTVEILSIERKNIPKTEFQPPVDYKRVDLMEISQQNMIDQGEELRGY